MLRPHWTMSWMGTFISSNCSRRIQDLFSHSQFPESVCCCINCRPQLLSILTSTARFKLVAVWVSGPGEPFSPRELPLASIFSLFFSRPLFCELKKWLRGKIPKMLRSTHPTPPLSDSQQLCHFQSHLQWLTIPSRSDGFSWSSASLIDHLHLSKCIEMCCWWVWGLGRD